MDSTKEYFLLADIYFIKNVGKLLDAAYDKATDTIDLAAVAMSIHKSRFALNAKAALKKYGSSESVVNAKCIEAVRNYILKVCSKKVTTLNRKIFDDVTAVQRELKNKKKSNRNYFKYYYSQRLNLRFETLIRVLNIEAELNIYRQAIAEAFQVIAADTKILTDALKDNTLYIERVVENLYKKTSKEILNGVHYKGICFVTNANQAYINMQSDINKVSTEMLKMLKGSSEMKYETSLNATYAIARRKGYEFMCEKEKVTQSELEEVRRTGWDKNFSDVLEVMLYQIFKGIKEQELKVKQVG